MVINKRTSNWLKLAERDLSFAEEIYLNSNFRSYSPHYCHQAIEKLLKAIIVLKSDDSPPYIHNLVKLANLTGIVLSKEQKDALASLNPHYIGTKYPEDIAKMFRLYGKNKVAEIYQETKKLFKWLKQNLK